VERAEIAAKPAADIEGDAGRQQARQLEQHEQDLGQQPVEMPDHEWRRPPDFPAI
jgi:hypothetical protein